MSNGIKTWFTRLFSFLYHLVRRFLENNGLLLSAAVSYKSLLSFIPLVALLIVGLSFIFPEERLMEMVRQQGNHLLPGQVNEILNITRSFLDSREIFSGFGLLTLVLFSGMGFGVLRDAVKAIFHDPEQPERRFWVSVLLPYLYIAVLGLSLLILTLLSILTDKLRIEALTGPGSAWEQYGGSGVLVSLMTLLGLALIFASFYKFLPVRSVSIRRALIGGSVAAVLWDLTRRGLMFYFTHLSMINVLYGSIATIIVLLVSLEIASGIVLFGAQITADLERNASRGHPWYHPPDRAV